MSRESDLQTYSLGWKASSSNTPTTCPFWADFRRLLMTMTSRLMVYLVHDKSIDYVLLAVVGIWYKTFHGKFWKRHFVSDEGY
ncbi:hypothetical protein MJO29_006288, partial [Puccinia striiformis f. sp. tritici]